MPRPPKTDDQPTGKVVSIVRAIEKRKAAARRKARVNKHHWSSAMREEAENASEFLEGIDMAWVQRELDAMGARATQDDRNLVEAMRGEQLCYRGEVAEGHAVWDRLATEHPDFAMVHSLRGMWVMREKPKEALSHFDHAVQLDPREADYYWRRGDCHKRLGDWDRALANYRRGIALDPNSVDGLFVIGRTLRGLGKHDEAVRYLSRAIRRAPRYADLLAHRALVFMFQKDYAAAIEDLDRAIALDPMYESARYKRAECMVECGDRTGAIEVLKALLNDRPEYEHAIAYLVELVGYQKRHAKYVEPLDRRIEAAPDDAQAWFERARAWRRVGDFDREKADIRRAAELAPDDMRIGDEAMEDRVIGTEDVPATIAMLDAYLERFPQSTRALHWRGAMYRRHGDYIRALADLQRILETKPESSSTYRDIAEVYGLMGRPEEGIEAATRALELAGDDAPRAGLALLTRAELREQIDPNDPAAAEDDARAAALEASDPGLSALKQTFEGMREVARELRKGSES